MNNGKDIEQIKQLDETGEQSAEMVSGGVNESFEGVSLSYSSPSNECLVTQKKCLRCGKEVIDLVDGKYCELCDLLGRLKRSKREGCPE